MALGTSSITRVRNIIQNIEGNNIKYGDISESTEALYSCYNTFQYVANNLKEWADDTVIGAQSKDNLTKLSNLFGELIEETRNILNRTKQFCDNQDRINGAKYVNSITNSNYDRTKGYKAGDLSALQ